MRKFAFQWKIIKILYMKISFLPKFDQFYEKSHTLKTPFAAAIVQFEFHCAPAITGPTITGRDLCLNSGSKLLSFRAYTFHEKFWKSVKFHRNRYFIEWFRYKHIRIQKSAQFEPKSRFYVFDADQGPSEYPESIFVDPVHVQCTTGLAGGERTLILRNPV